jgi:hypothetical protein
MYSKVATDFKIRLAKVEDGKKISDLRITAYKKATGAILKNSDFLRWHPTDNQAAVLYIENSANQVISSMRGVTCDSVAELECLLDISVERSLKLPILALDKAVTCIHHRRLGLIAILRSILLEAAKNAGVGCIAITINEGASRIPHLKEIGFEFEEADLSKRTDSDFNNSTKVFFAVLHRDSFEQAINVAKNSLECGLSSVVQGADLPKLVVQQMTI